MRVLLAACVALIVGGCIADGGGKQPGSGGAQGESRGERGGQDRWRGETTNSSCEGEYYYCFGGDVHRDPYYDKCEYKLSGQEKWHETCDFGCSESGDGNASCDSGSGGDSCQSACYEECQSQDPPEDCFNACIAACGG